MEVYGNDIPSFRRFLENFCRDHHGEVKKEDKLPFRLVTFNFILSELEGEVLDWSLQYLNSCHCPPVLAAHIVQRVREELLALDKTQYLETIEDQPPHIDANVFARVVFSKVHEICEKWREDFATISFPQRPPDYAIHAIKNSRRKMEDKHVILPDLNTVFGIKDKPQQSFYAVFDGHGGVDGSTYAAAHLVVNLVNNPSFHTDVSTAIKESFLQTDKMFIEKCEREPCKSGSTGVLALVRERKLHIAWLGDSQVMMVRAGKVVTLMNPHKPEREDERKRIESLGGCVVWFGAWRVNGSLSVSRAIGDTDHKPFVSADADLATFDLEGDEDYMVLACDGLWDTVKPQDLLLIVNKHLKEGHDRSTVSQKLVQVAKDNGSNDNISVIVVYFRKEVAEPRPDSGITFNFGGLREKGPEKEDPGKGDEDKGHNKEGTTSPQNQDEGSKVEGSGESGKKASNLTLSSSSTSQEEQTDKAEPVVSQSPSSQGSQSYSSCDKTDTTPSMLTAKSSVMISEPSFLIYCRDNEASNKISTEVTKGSRSDRFAQEKSNPSSPKHAPNGPSVCVNNNSILKPLSQNAPKSKQSSPKRQSSMKSTGKDSISSKTPAGKHAIKSSGN